MHLKEIIKVTKTLKLLYVEDDEISRSSINELLSNFFTHITVAKNGQEGLEKFKENNFDIILSDINMPKLNGIDMVMEIRKSNKDIPVIFLSAHNESKYLLEGIKLGIESFLLKPLHLNNLRNALFRISEKIILRRENRNYQLHLESEVKKQTQELDRKLHFDELTGLYSRYSFFEDIKNTLYPNVFIVDINKLRVINQIYGTRVGTFVLVEFASFLKEFTKNTRYKVYRLSADEFILRDEELGIDTDKYEEDMKSFLKSLSHFSVEIENDSISIEVTIGMSIGQKDAFECAKIALEYAKAHRKVFEVYTKGIDKRDEEQDALLWKNKTKQAIEDNRIMPVYHPIVNQDAKVVKYETLMRLRDKEKGNLIEPAYFLDIAIKTGLYDELSASVIFDGLHKLDTSGHSLSFNFTYADIINKSFLNEIESFFITSPELATRATFEITESEVIEDYADIKNFIKRFRKYGVQFAIDDFGSGFSNFEYILEIEPDYLKIDGSLVKNIDTNEKSHILVNAIVDFSHRLGIKVIAEYVHSDIIFQMLKKLNVDEFQGFYFSKPIENI